LNEWLLEIALLLKAKKRKVATISPTCCESHIYEVAEKQSPQQNFEGNMPQWAAVITLWELLAHKVSDHHHLHLLVNQEQINFQDV
jgi:hypothetical protein